MSQKRSRVKMNVDIAKMRKAGKDPREVQKRLLDFFRKRGFSYEVHIGYLYHRQFFQKCMVAAKTNCQIIGKQIRKKQIYIKNNKKRMAKESGLRYNKNN